MANEKDLKKLKAEEKQAVAGGDIYYGGLTYFVPNPTKSNGKYFKYVSGLSLGKKHEQAAGRETTVHRYKTEAEAKAAAEEEGRILAFYNGDVRALMNDH